MQVYLAVYDKIKQDYSFVLTHKAKISYFFSDMSYGYRRTTIYENGYRNLGYKSDYWGFPGGEVNSGENLFIAANREFHEETGVIISDYAVTRTLIESEKYCVCFVEVNNASQIAYDIIKNLNNSLYDRMKLILDDELDDADFLNSKDTIRILEAGGGKSNWLLEAVEAFLRNNP